MANQLMKQPATDRVIAPSDPDEKRRFWIDRGNRILWGQEPTSKGDYLEPKTHLHWVCIDGNYFIEERAETHRKAMMANPNYARAA